MSNVVLDKTFHHDDMSSNEALVSQGDVKQDDPGRTRASTFSCDCHDFCYDCNVLQKYYLFSGGAQM